MKTTMLWGDSGLPRLACPAVLLRIAGYAMLATSIAINPATVSAAEDKPADAAAAAETGPEVITVWPDGAPAAAGDDEADRPTLSIYTPPDDKRQRAAVVICPGGGYQHLAVGHEGTEIAEWLNSLGVTAGILRYRLAPRYKHPAMLQDAQRAVRIVRASAAKREIDADKIGVIGFSAGGHLVSTIATHFDAGRSEATDQIEQASCRPDFAILVYPVIAIATEYAHGGSRKNLLGDNPPQELLESLSNERMVTADTPPCFLVHSGTDKAVPPENSVLFYLALRKAKVPAEMHIFEEGPHGFGLGKKDPSLKLWPGLCAEWLAEHGVIR
ncbi:MAG: alpha/beta hydrolase [Pirellulales bacterium]